MIRRAAPVALLVALGCAAGAGQAGASAFYNQSESGQPNPAQVYLDCGLFCNNDFSIPVGQGAARPGTGGSFWLGNIGGFTGQPSAACDLGTGHPDVQDHGWAELHYLNARYEWQMWGTNEQPISGSPFAVQFGVFDSDPEFDDCISN
jgi:hypothetical protein